MVFGFWQQSNSEKALAKAPSLSEGAATVYRAAKDRRLPLSYVAERHSLGAQFWFADSLLRQSAVYGKRRGESAYTHLSLEQLTDLTLSTDMSALLNAQSAEPQIADLRTPPAELKRYLRWALTVQ